MAIVYTKIYNLLNLMLSWLGNLTVVQIILYVTIAKYK